MGIDAYMLLKTGAGADAKLEGESWDKVFSGFIEIHKFDIGALKDPTSSQEKFDVNRNLYREEREKSYEWTMSDIGGLFDEGGGLDTIAADAGEQMVGPGEDAFSFKIHKNLDSSSPDLFLNYCQTCCPADESTGEDTAFHSAKVYLRKSGPDLLKSGLTPESASFLIFTFDKPHVVHYTIEASGGDSSVPEESITFHFKKYAIQYKIQDLNGKLQAASQSPIGWAVGSGDDGGEPWDGAS